MRRSKVLAKLKNVLWIADDKFDLESPYVDKLAELVLTAVEDIGMLPPVINPQDLMYLHLNYWDPEVQESRRYGQS